LSRPEVRAVVLAAGHGQRLRPLTEFAPKPLLPVHGSPILSRTLAAIAELGCERAAINLHHLGENIRQALGGAHGGVGITYSEEKELLGTLGALVRLREFLAPADLVLIVNGDSLCRWPLKALVAHHRSSGAAATLLMSKRARPENFGGGVTVDAEGRILAFSTLADAPEGSRQRVFAGAHVFSPKLLEGLEDGPSDTVRDLYQPLLESGAVIDSLETTRRWYDLGTPARLLEGVLDWKDGGWGSRLARQPWRAPSSQISRAARVRNSVVEHGVVIGEAASVEGSVLLTGARVGPGCTVRDSIVGYDTVLREGTDVEGRMVTPVIATVPPREIDSVVGGLVYSPII